VKWFSIGISFGFSNWYLQNFTLVWEISIGIISLCIYFKTLLKAKGRISGGAFIKSKEKHLKQGEKFQNSNMLLAIIFLYLWLFAKDFERIFPKELQKLTIGVNVVQNVK
jgi:hypothetical protein